MDCCGARFSERVSTRETQIADRERRLDLPPFGGASVPGTLTSLHSASLGPAPPASHGPGHHLNATVGFDLFDPPLFELSTLSVSTNPCTPLANTEQSARPRPLDVAVSVNTHLIIPSTFASKR
jgi:hypothetical protein